MVSTNREGRTVVTLKEILAVTTALQREWPEGTSTETVSRALIKALDATRGTTWRPIGPPLKAGQAFRSIIDSATHVVAWVGPDADGCQLAWIVSETSNYGWIGAVDSQFWRWTEPVADEARVRKVSQGKRDHEGNLIYVDGVLQRETVEKSFGGIVEKLTTNDLGMKPGDKVTLRQDGQYTVEAVARSSVLLRNRQTRWVWAEENSNLEKFYKDGWRN